jgi:hypothetical protein
MVAGVYQAQGLPRDRIAGVTLAAYAVPVAMASASRAGLPRQSGISCYLLGGVCYAWFGTARPLAIAGAAAQGRREAGQAEVEDHWRRRGLPSAPTTQPRKTQERPCALVGAAAYPHAPSAAATGGSCARGVHANHEWISTHKTPLARARGADSYAKRPSQQLRQGTTQLSGPPPRRRAPWHSAVPRFHHGCFLLSPICGITSPTDFSHSHTVCCTQPRRREGGR